ncbi:MAG: CxxxxCH/CxxCH domain-containing protein [Kofleriaceae bacterium]
MRWLVLVLAVAACAAERARPDAAPAQDTVHPIGILDSTSESFHGRELARRGWDLGLCASCHGEAFDGGAAKVSCKTCHDDGPDACATCHRDGPTTGAHASHRGALVACAECHTVPARWDDPGHVRTSGAADPPPAEVVLGARAAQTLDPVDRAGAPSFADGTCSNVYCHGDVLHAGGGLMTDPRWDDPAPSGTCGRCHGAPPPSHVQDRCASCHPAELHLDGAIQVGRTPGCDGCHGDATSPAPPIDLSGNTFTTAIGVGAHRAHLEAPARLRGPIACETCHLVPAQVFATGHLDTALPAEVTAGLGWDQTTGTCTTAGCHGPARPVWTEQGGAFCGSCHGIPPVSHAPGPLTGCATCHPRAIDSTGTIILTPGPTGPTSEHLDGDVDVF